MDTVAALTATDQSYLMAIRTAETNCEDSKVTVGQLAHILGSSASSVSEKISKLVKAGLVQHPKYGGISLTDAGRAYSTQMRRRHRLLETFLVQTLGYSWDEVHEEADVLEHAVSDRFIEALAAHLDHPTRDPHGDPIPSAAGEELALDAVTLDSVEQGQTVVITRVCDANAELLRLLEQQGLLLDTHITISYKNTASGLISLICPGHTEVTLGLTAAGAIWVSPAS